MKLPSPAAPALAPLGVTVNLSTALDASAPSTGMHRAEHAEVAFGRPDALVDAYVDTYDPLWDGPVPEPAHPGDWHASRAVSSSPALRDAVGGLQALVATLDLAAIARPDRGAGSHATFHVRYAERPTSVHPTVRPYQDRDGSWVVMLETSIDDLLANPALMPLVDAARTVISAAR